MVQKRVLAITILIVAGILLSSAIGMCGTPLQINKAKQPAVQTPIPVPAPAPTPAKTPAIIKKQAVQPVVKHYRMAIQSIGLTDKCQLKVILKNIGDNLSADQHKNSKLKLGSNGTPVSLKTIDPTGKLRIKGQTITYVGNKSRTQTGRFRITISVILFNNKTISRIEYLTSTCLDPKTITPVKTQVEVPKIPQSTEQQLPLKIKKAKQPAAPPTAPPVTPAIKNDLVMQEVGKEYSMAIQSLGQTDKCQVTLMLRNTGDDLSEVQHKNSYLKDGNNPPMSLVSIDPAGKLRTNGQIVTYIRNKPLSRGARKITFSVTLFNGKKKSIAKYFVSKCLDPEKVTPVAINPQSDAKTGKTKLPKTPQSSEQQPPQQIQQAEVMLHGSQKVPLSPQPQQVSPSSPDLSQAKTKPVVDDLSCSITVSYDQAGTDLIQSTGPKSGTYVVPSGSWLSQPLVWTHVKIDYVGTKSERERMGTYKVLVQYSGHTKKYGYWGAVWEPYTKDFNYTLSMFPGESHEYNFKQNPMANYSYDSQGFYPVTVQAEVDTANFLKEANESNNKCQYTIRFKK